MVSGAPITVAIIAIAIWAISQHLYKDRIHSAKELLDLKSRQLSEIQDKTGAKSPEDVLDKLSRIEDRLGELRTAESIDSFVEALDAAMETGQVDTAKA